MKFILSTYRTGNQSIFQSQHFQTCVLSLRHTNPGIWVLTEVASFSEIPINITKSYSLQRQQQMPISSKTQITSPWSTLTMNIHGKRLRPREFINSQEISRKGCKRPQYSWQPLLLFCNLDSLMLIENAWMGNTLLVHCFSLLTYPSIFYWWVFLIWAISRSSFYKSWQENKPQQQVCSRLFQFLNNALRLCSLH